MDAWNKKEEVTDGGEDGRMDTSHTKDGGGRLLLGLTFNRKERKRRRRSENIHRHSERCMLGCDMLVGLPETQITVKYSERNLSPSSGAQTSDNKNTIQKEWQTCTSPAGVSATALPEKISFSFMTLMSLLDLLTAALSMICSGL